MATLAAQIDTFGEKIVDWALSGTELTDDPVRGYPLARLSSAMAIVSVYLAFVVAGSIVGKLTSGSGVKLYGMSFLYNIVQVMLCSYMCIEAALIASREGYSLVCNKFNLTNPPVARVLWLFYVSKVRSVETSQRNRRASRCWTLPTPSSS